jgi:hypothetical protein
MRELFGESSRQSPENARERLPKIDERDFETLNTIGGQFEGIVEDANGSKFVSLWADQKIVYDFERKQLVKTANVTEAYGSKKPLEQSLDVDGYRTTLSAFSITGGLLAPAISLEHSYDTLGISRMEMRLLAESLQQYIVNAHQAIFPSSIARRNIRSFIREWIRENTDRNDQDEGKLKE